MIIASPSMSTNAVIMRTVSFPFMLLSRNQRGSDIANDAQRSRRDLVHGVLRRVVRSVSKIDDVEDVKSGVEEWNVVVDYPAAALLDEYVGISKIGRRLPHPRNDF